MPKMLIRFLPLLTACLALAGTSPAEVHGENMSVQARAALNYFLRLDCGVGQPQQALRNLQRFQAEVEPDLIAILQEMPGQKAVEQLEKYLETRWEQRQAYLATKPALGLSDRQEKSLYATTKDTYMVRRREEVLLKYQENAILALAAFASKESIEALHAASDTADPQRRQAILRVLKNRQRSLPAGNR